MIDKIDQNRFWYTEQRNKCVELLRDTRKNYYKKWDEKDLRENKKFRPNVKSYLSDKTLSEKIHLNENGELTKSETETAEVLNNFFSNIVKNFPEYENLNSNIENVKDQFLE